MGPRALQRDPHTGRTVVQTWERRPGPQGLLSGRGAQGSDAQAPPTLLSSPGLSARPATLQQPWAPEKPPLCFGAVGRVKSAPLQFCKGNIKMAFPPISTPQDPPSCLLPALALGSPRVPQ